MIYEKFAVDEQSREKDFLLVKNFFNDDVSDSTVETLLNFLYSHIDEYYKKGRTINVDKGSLTFKQVGDKLFFHSDVEEEHITISFKVIDESILSTYKESEPYIKIDISSLCKSFKYYKNPRTFDTVAIAKDFLGFPLVEVFYDLYADLF